jgi:GNAT superfamily N-acetyltransferase
MRVTPVAEINATQRQRLAAHVTVEITDPTHPDARHCLSAYFAELARRFDSGFDQAQSISANDAEVTPPRGLFLVARLQGNAVGCAALKIHRESGVGEVKRMWISPDARGLGLGRRLLTDLEREAISRGVHTLRLETNQALEEAIQLYRTAGFQEVDAFNEEQYAHFWFEKKLEPARD